MMLFIDINTGGPCVSLLWTIVSLWRHHCLSDRAMAASVLPPGGSLRDAYSECHCLRTLNIPILHMQHPWLCVCVSGCVWKERAHTSALSLAWCSKPRSRLSCGTRSYPGPSSAHSSETPGNLPDPSLTWTRSIKMPQSSSLSSSPTQSALPVRIIDRAVWQDEYIIFYSELGSLFLWWLHGPSGKKSHPSCCLVVWKLL